MKITVVGPAYPYRGGIALFSNQLAEALIAKGHQLDMVTFKMQYPTFLFPGETQFSESRPTTEIHTIRAINSVNPFNWIRVGQQIKKQAPDLVIFAYWMPFMAPCFGSIARIIKTAKKSKIIALVHNLVPHEKRIGDKILTNYFVKPIDAFLTMSKSVVEAVEKFDHLKPKRISPHPLYDNFGPIRTKTEALKKLGLDSSFKYLLFFGIVRKYKGLDLLLEAFTNSRLNDGKTKLIVAGEFYDSEEEYVHFIQDNNLQDSVILTKSFIADNEVVNYFCAADIVVQPYRTATQSGVTQIAYHFEKPMLVTDVGGLKEIVPHEKVGYVVDPKPHAISDALIDFYQNNREKEMVEGVKEEKKKYSWEKMAETVEDLYNNLD